jgi:hypothetical protein
VIDCLRLNLLNMNNLSTNFKQNYVYTLKCELFRYEDEIIDTGVDFIDDVLSGSSGSGISTISLGMQYKN